MDEIRKELGDKSVRVIIRVRATDLPGHPRDRENTVAYMVCKHVLGRDFNRDLLVANYDFAHSLPGLDTMEPTIRRWFICDLKVTCRLRAFAQKLQQAEPIKRYCAMFCWGGKVEQEEIARMRKVSATEEENPLHQQPRVTGKPELQS
ncbi:hypothetical protein K402DRAFT_424274 [Aulographum hederae CBS 113979]|uniref:Uncharacterized protein n=1 Tax=Aulographum hederae CBS 113979 TaxID=1176131 RepID=A0A6G1GPN1_9PEZI|nr:hypothetical protein K402DRAFT_424274 [Aulographum hederae CBS 113979]